MFFKQKFPYKRHFLIIVPIILTILFGLQLSNYERIHFISSANAEETKEKKILYWTCGMHPSVRMDKPGKCPICAMDLIPVYEKGIGAEEEGTLASVELSERARKLAQVKTDVIGFRSLTKDVYTVGLIEYDERRKAVVSAWVPGRIDKLFIDFTGTEVIKGESMVWMYSPELVSTQKEYLLALETYEKVQQSPFQEVVDGAQSLIDAAEKRLLWWGITKNQIQELRESKKIQQHMIIYSPMSGIVVDKMVLEGQYVKEGDAVYTVVDLSNVWMKAHIYEYEMSWIKIGQEVEITTPTYPGEVFIGKISFIEPYLDEATRSVKIRCDIPNADLKLKPSMYVNAKIRIPIEEVEQDDKRYSSGLDYSCPDHPEIKSSRPGICPIDNKEFINISKTEKGVDSKEIIREGEGSFLPSETPDKHAERGYEFACPMNCYVSDKPADCPICGMKLVKREIVAGESDEKLVCICGKEWDPATSPQECPMCGSMVRKRETIVLPSGEKEQKYIYMCPMACMTSDKPGECPDCKRQLGRWEKQKISGVPGKNGELKKREVFTCPMHPEVTSDKPDDCPKCGKRLEKTTQVLAIPATAVLDTGIRKIVYIDKGNGQYIGKEVILGPKTDAYYPVLDGLEEGDRVVTSANFLIDSQSQLTGGASALYGGAMEFKDNE
ncbi:MAG: HlyD family efflux transporter periplasmic adaptor subunit [Candidatus Kuenenia sp.]|nr:HlyD family efflux transporter periplasmic adaptor subunit [Candidatus Kuenenia hertensis]